MGKEIERLCDCSVPVALDLAGASDSLRFTWLA